MNKRKIVLKELKTSIKGYTFWGHLYFFLNDYFGGVGIIISLLAPFGFAAILYLPVSDLSIINFWFMLITGFGVVLSLIRHLFGFPKRSKFILKQKIDTEEVQFLLKTKKIKVKKAVEKLNNIRRKDYTENDI